MITDNQIEEIYETTDTAWNDNWLIDFARSVISANEKSKWINFDVGDYDTWPADGECIIDTGCGLTYPAVFKIESNDMPVFLIDGYIKGENVVAWMAVSDGD